MRRLRHLRRLRLVPREPCTNYMALKHEELASTYLLFTAIVANLISVAQC